MRQLHKAIRYIFTAENLLLEKTHQCNTGEFNALADEISTYTTTLANGLKFSASYMSEEATEFIPANETMDRKAFVIKGYVTAIQKRDASYPSLVSDLDDMISIYTLAHEIAVEKNEIIIARFLTERLESYKTHRVGTRIIQESSQ